MFGENEQFMTVPRPGEVLDSPFDLAQGGDSAGLEIQQVQARDTGTYCVGQEGQTGAVRGPAREPIVRTPGLTQELPSQRHQGDPAPRPLTLAGEAAGCRERQGLPVRGEPRLSEPLDVQQLVKGDH